ncbi:glycosyltransferase family protein [Acinetobacter indicus]|uniref:glycosyltransferase n=1 Tax=Acinetobacter indicus TaxID=756892 RepID=UPI001315898D|nr:glycosyltransferase [Acinetobacter indicus]
MKKVLILSYSFPPFNNIASRRFGDMVEYFESFGWDAYVLTTKSKGDLPVNIDESKVYRIGSLRNSFNNKVKSDLSKDKLSSLRRQLGFVSRLLDSTYFSFYIEFKKTNFLEQFKKLEFDLIISSFGPGSALFLGKYISEKLCIPLVIDFRDLGALHVNEPNNRNFISIFLDKIIEKKLLKDCIGITTVSNGLMEELTENYNINNKAVIYNGFNSSIDENVNASEQYFYYAGRFYENQIKSIFLLLDYIERNRGYKLIIRSLGPLNLEKKIIDYASTLGVSDNLIVLDPADSITVQNEASRSFANIVVESLDTEINWKKGVLTGKLMGLLCMKPPILSIARKDSEIGEVLSYTMKGVCVHSLPEIEMFVEKIYENKFSYCGDKNKILEFSKKAQAKKLCSFLDSIV